MSECQNCKGIHLESKPTCATVDARLAVLEARGAIPVPRETLEQVRSALSGLTHPVCDAVDLDDEPPCGCCDVCEGRAALDLLNRLLGGGS